VSIARSFAQSPIARDVNVSARIQQFSDLLLVACLYSAEQRATVESVKVSAVLQQEARHISVSIHGSQEHGFIVCARVCARIEENEDCVQPATLSRSAQGQAIFGVYVCAPFEQQPHDIHVTRAPAFGCVDERAVELSRAGGEEHGHNWQASASRSPLQRCPVASDIPIVLHS